MKRYGPIFVLWGIMLIWLTSPLCANDYPFAPVDTSYTATEVLIPPNCTYQILFQENDPVLRWDGVEVPAKGKHDFIGYVPIDGSSEHGYLFVNHEEKKANTDLGNGGSVTYFEIKKISGKWMVVSDKKAVDFRLFEDENGQKAGETWNNCGGMVSPFGTVLTTEEYEPVSNEELIEQGWDDVDSLYINFYDNDADLTQKLKVARYETLGWMVEIDPQTGQAIKHWGMGRFSHEGGWCMPDRQTVYMTDDTYPSVFFKFVADEPGDYGKGQLYCFQQSDNGGEWLAMPMDFQSLANARETAMKMGATVYVRFEWMVLVDDKLYITETGRDFFHFDDAVKFGAQPAAHLDPYRIEDEAYEYAYSDIFGRILVFDPETNHLQVFLEGGQSETDPSLNFSNPDGISHARINNKDYLIINEDINGESHGRHPAYAQKWPGICEIYWLDLSIPQPSVDDLLRFMVAPGGSETTGPMWTPDFKTYFVNIQHPNPDNPEPFNRATTIAITGW